MAFIHGRIPDNAPVKFQTRVVVKLSVVASRSGVAATSDTRAVALTELRRAAPEANFNPYFEGDKGVRAAMQPPFDRYVVTDVEDQEAARSLILKLQQLKGIEEAYVEGGPTPPPVNPTDDPLSGSQGYLDASPAGIDARWLWQVADGNGIGFVDLEQGWTLSHEDLAAAGISIISGVSHDYQGHGTAVLGEVMACDNAIGCIGIAPRANARVVSEWRTDTSFNRAEAILSAGQVMTRGDVLLLEAQTTFNGLSFAPAELEPAVFDAIRKLVDEGIVVVEAAGNGGHDLDAYRDSANRFVLDRASADFRDSGAIMVGAASSTTPHTRLSFSNYGSRIDCYGWGENIVTTGDGWRGTSTTEYTTGFGGTSGASPMITGAALLLQSWRKSRQEAVYSPQDLRDMLSSIALNTLSANPSSDRIGVMPNLRAIVEAEIANEKYQVNRDKYINLVYILLGLIDDRPGFIWVPGKGPVPVNPGWGPMASKIDAPKRDLLAAMAVNEIATQINDETVREKLGLAALNAMREAVERIGRS